jgi:hypothetical protein
MRSLVCALAILLTVAGCGTEIGRASFTGEGKREVAVSMASAGEVFFDASLEYLRPSNRSPYLEEWSLKIETLRGKTEPGSTRTCDALNVSPGLTGVESCNGPGHTNCTQSASARIHDCRVRLEAGDTTLRLTLEPNPNARSSIKVKRLDVVVKR